MRHIDITTPPCYPLRIARTHNTLPHAYHIDNEAATHDCPLRVAHTHNTMRYVELSYASSNNTPSYDDSHSRSPPPIVARSEQT